MPMKKGGTLIIIWSRAVMLRSIIRLFVLPAQMPRGMDRTMVKAKDSSVSKAVTGSLSESISDTGMR